VSLLFLFPVFFLMFLLDVDFFSVAMISVLGPWFFYVFGRVFFALPFSTYWFDVAATLPFSCHKNALRASSILCIVFGKLREAFFGIIAPPIPLSCLRCPFFPLKETPVLFRVFSAASPL